MPKTIADVDSNFAVASSVKQDGMVFYDVLSEPFSLHGIFLHDGKFRRLPETVAAAANEGVHFLHGNTAGGRVRFCTDSPYVAIHARMPFIGKMPHFALTGSAGFDLYAKENSEQVYIGTFQPPFEITDGYESILWFPDRHLREITVNFPLYSDVERLCIGLADNAALQAPAPYTHAKPFVFYGSSITQGGCASRPGCSYQSILSRRFDLDYINLGFSGSARGEDVLFEYIAGLDMAAFIYDYDHNAPTTEHLAHTHERGFLRIRQAHPTVPIVLMTRPKVRLDEDETIRLGIVRTTYEKAVARGDDHVYFLPGTTLMAMAGNEGTVDGCHPTDLGFVSMAKALGTVLENILTKE